MLHKSTQLAGKQHKYDGALRVSVINHTPFGDEQASCEAPQFATFSSPAVASNSRACGRDLYTDRT
jgi:hypothetical protein